MGAEAVLLSAQVPRKFPSQQSVSAYPPSSVPQIGPQLFTRFLKGHIMLYPKVPKRHPGIYPCGQCIAGCHDDCRPTLASTPCTCNCVKAATFRDQLLAYRAEHPHLDEVESVHALQLIC